MTKSPGKEILKSPFLGRYKEINIEYDLDLLGVNVTGVRDDNTSEDILIEFDVDSPESYAYGIYDMLKALYPSLYLYVGPAKLIEEAGFFLEHLDPVD